MPSWQSKVFRRGFETGRRQLYGDVTDMPALRARLDKLSRPMVRWTDLAYERVEGAPVPAEWVYPKRESLGRKERSLERSPRDDIPERSPRDTCAARQCRCDVPVQRTVIYLHGGGYCVGSIATHRVLAGEVARACQARAPQTRALVIDYRMGPEDPFPAAVEDSVAAYEWLISQGTEPGQVVLAGDSAGGGLVLSTLVSLRDQGLPLPAAGVCLSPWTDLCLSGESMVRNAKKDLVLTKEMLQTFRENYLGDGDPCQPLASPLYADLSGLPPLLLQASAHEILFDDAKRTAERAQDAGVEVVLDVWEEMVHVWQSYPQFLPESREAISRIGEFVIAHSRGASSAS